MTKPLISIIVPVYNLEKYIEKTLNSIFAQTYENIEVIAVNDGSKDSTAKILDEYAEKESRLKVIHKENGGVNRARLTGIRAANGEYIGFVDGDDLIDSDMYERLYGNAVKYNADISHCGYRMIRPDKTVKYYYNKNFTKMQNNKEGVEDLLKGEFIEPGLVNKLYKTELFSKILSGNTLFDDSLIINEDLLMNYFLFKASKFSVYEDFCPYQYIKRENSASQSEARLCDYEHPIKVRQIIYKDCFNTEFSRLAKKIYLSKVIHYLIKVPCKGIFENFEKDLCEIVIKNKDGMSLLSFKQKFISFCVIYLPFIFKLMKSFINKFRR